MQVKLECGNIGSFKRPESQITRRESSPTCRTPCQDQMLNKFVGNNRTTPSLLRKFGNIVPPKKTSIQTMDTVKASCSCDSLTIKHFLHNSACVYFFDYAVIYLNTLSALIITIENNSLPRVNVNVEVIMFCFLFQGR